jgi:hypothetical protein
MSSINPNNINDQYPVAGQDNDSQGFRDNFTNIKNNLRFAQEELNDLQQKAVLKSALQGTTINNDFNDSQLIGAQCLRLTETRVDLGVITDPSVNVTWTNGHFHQMILESSSTTITFGGWPAAQRHTKLRLLIDVKAAAVSGNYTVTFSTTFSGGSVGYHGLGDIKNMVNGNVFTPTAAGLYLFEFSTVNAGGNVMVSDMLRNRITNVEEYQVLTPADGEQANVSAYTSTVIIHPAEELSTANIVMPGNTQVSDGQTISFAFGNTITTVTHFGNGATITGGLTTAGVTTAARYIYKASTNNWYRLG